MQVQIIIIKSLLHNKTSTPLKPPAIEGMIEQDVVNLLSHSIIYENGPK